MTVASGQTLYSELRRLDNLLFDCGDSIAGWGLYMQGNGKQMLSAAQVAAIRDRVEALVAELLASAERIHALIPQEDE